MSTGISEYAAGFQYTDNERGITVTRVFHYDPDSTTSSTVEVPKPGDKFECPFTGNITDILYMPQDTKNKIICRERTMTPLAGDQRKYQWTVTYNNEPVDVSVFIKPEEGTPVPTAIKDLPINLEYSGEFLTLNGKNWIWTDGSTVQQPLAKRINQSTLRITRYINDQNYNIFQANVKATAGTVNNITDPFKGLGGLSGDWLFVGATTEIFRNNLDNKWWRAELEFVYRSPDVGADPANPADGWNKVMKEDGTWDMPKDSSGYKIYRYTDFSVLFNDVPAS